MVNILAKYEIWEKKMDVNKDCFLDMVVEGDVQFYFTGEKGPLIISLFGEHTYE